MPSLNWQLQLHLHCIVLAHSGWVFATVGRIIRWNNSAGTRRHMLLSLKVGGQGIILRVMCYARMSQSPPKPNSLNQAAVTNFQRYQGGLRVNDPTNRYPIPSSQFHVQHQGATSIWNAVFLHCPVGTSKNVAKGRGLPVHGILSKNFFDHDFCHKYPEKRHNQVLWNHISVLRGLYSAGEAGKYAKRPNWNVAATNPMLKNYNIHQWVLELSNTPVWYHNKAVSNDSTCKQC